MEKFKSISFFVIIFILIILLGYWAVATMESGSDHVANQEIKKLKEENKELKKEIDSLLLQNEEQVIEEPETEVITEPQKEVESSKYQNLINDLQKLIDDKVTMKKGSKGARVGTIQEFLNVYNGTSNRIDNDYGAKTITALKKFEEEQKLIITEEIGPNTFKVMIDWLKKQ